MPDYRKEAAREESSRKAWRDWLGQRVETIHNKVTAHDVLRHGGVNLGGNGEEQFSCPFHGVDSKPSARVYPGDARSRSHAWCFVCQERWDAIELWKKFNAGEDKTFSRIVREMEQAFGIAAPDMPTEVTWKDERSDTQMESFIGLCEAVERRLLGARDAYAYLEDLRGYLSAGQVLDRVMYKVDNKRMTPEQGEEVLRTLLSRIAEKVRSCPVG